MEGASQDSHALVGYACVAAGVMDGLLALFMVLSGKPADARVRRNLVIMFGISGVVVVGIGAAFLLGVFAKEG